MFFSFQKRCYNLPIFHRTLPFLALLNLIQATNAEKKRAVKQEKYGEYP